MKVDKSVYQLYKQSYQKMYRDKKRDENKIVCFENIEDMTDCNYFKYESNLIESIYIDDEIDKLYMVLERLSLEERKLIIELYFNNKSGRQLAYELGIPTTTLHNKKVKILKKLKKIWNTNK